MLTSLRLIIFFLLISSLSFAQSSDSKAVQPDHSTTGTHAGTDSVKIKPAKKIFFEVMPGFTNYTCTNKSFSKTTPTLYGFQHEQLILKQKSNYFFSLKIAFGHIFNKYVGIVLGIKYAYIGPVSYTYISYTRATVAAPSSYYDVSSNDNFHYNVTHNIQLFIGPKVTFKNFYLIPTVNMNVLHIKQSITKGSGVSSQGGGPTYGDIDFAETNVWSNEADVGAGANLGYELPISNKCTFSVEVQWEYLERNIGVATEGGMRFIGKGIAVGLKF